MINPHGIQTPAPTAPQRILAGTELSVPWLAGGDPEDPTTLRIEIRDLGGTVLACYSWDHLGTYLLTTGPSRYQLRVPGFVTRDWLGHITLWALLQTAATGNTVPTDFNRTVIVEPGYGPT